MAPSPQNPDRGRGKRRGPGGRGGSSGAKGGGQGSKRSGSSGAKGGGQGSKRSGQGGGQGAKGGGARRGGRSDAPRSPAEDTVSELAGPLRTVLERLPETQRRVLELRMGLVDGHPHDLADTARELGLSLSEARDIEKRAFEHIREAVPLDQLQRFLSR